MELGVDFRHALLVALTVSGWWWALVGGVSRTLQGTGTRVGTYTPTIPGTLLVFTVMHYAYPTPSFMGCDTGRLLPLYIITRYLS